LRPRYTGLLVAAAVAATLTVTHDAARITAAADAPEASKADETLALQTFNQILALVEENYVDEVDSQELVRGAIRGMLSTLDPHSALLEPKAYTEMREEQKGSFSGLGIVISMKGEVNELTVISPIEGTPAFRAGIRAGDHISQIEGQSTDGITIDEALERLRGPRGTKVTITILRDGYDKPLRYTLVRDDIPTVSIDYAWMIRPGVGYIRIKSFTQTTEAELDEKIRMLRAQGMEKLLLDLRWNPGGLLEQAWRVSDKFLKKNSLIVYTKGRLRRESDREYHSMGRSERLDMPLVVLVNKGSASASEIVAGAIQDHDRGLIVGDTTWGKGLVQTVYPLAMGHGLALTTAKYYTPSGRLIQRDYDSFEDYVMGNNIAPEGERQTSYTDAGRKVLGGGGISPDVEVSLDEPSQITDTLERKTAFFDFAVSWTTNHPEPPDRASFQVSDAILADFKSFLARKKKDVKITDEEFKANVDYIRLAIKAEIYGYHWGREARQKVLAERDKQILKAIELFPQASQLPILAERPAVVETDEKPR